MLPGSKDPVNYEAQNIKAFKRVIYGGMILLGMMGVPLFLNYHAYSHIKGIHRSDVREYFDQNRGSRLMDTPFPLIDELGCWNPEVADAIAAQLAVSPNPIHAYQLKQHAPERSWLDNSELDELFYFILHQNGDVNGRFWGITTLKSGRDIVILDAIREIIPEIPNMNPGGKIRIRDEGVSTGSVTIEVIKALKSELRAIDPLFDMDRLSFTATDIITELTFIVNTESGEIGVFSDVKPDIMDNLVRWVSGNEVYMSRSEFEKLPKIRNWMGSIYALFPDFQTLKEADFGEDRFTPFREAFKMYQHQKKVPAGFDVRSMSTTTSQMDRWVESGLINLENHSIFDALPDPEKAHLTIISNVLIPRKGGVGYFSYAEIFDALLQIGNNTEEGGYVLVINEHKNPVYGGPLGRTVTDDRYIHPFSLFQKKGETLYLVAENHQGFNYQQDGIRIHHFPLSRQKNWEMYTHPSDNAA